MDVLVLSEKDVRQAVGIKDALEATRLAFTSYGQAKALMPKKVYLPLEKYHGDLRAMPAFLEDLDACGIKWVNSHPNNTTLGLPTVMALLILNDPKTGTPLALMDATLATSMRTGAAGALASSYLAKKGAQVLALIGSGVQAVFQLKAHLELFPIKEVRVWSNNRSSVERFMREVRDIGVRVEAVNSVSEAARGADIICTTTPSREPILKLKDLTGRVHINAIGADAPGKQELEIAILKNALVVVDDWEQASHGGELNRACSQGVFTKADLYASLSEMVCGKKLARGWEDKITVFDSTGLAIQDLALAKAIYGSAKARGLGQSISF